ncbi:MAG: hypothetical protein QNJ22_18355 [Desulfosarcinaceae bacterium]|nr:hypothetical protein [Desulfosarcinaceae bacterium]
MAPIDEAYTETTDIYLEILWQAQRVEDQKLVAMIKERLSRSAVKLHSVEPCGNIIPFPALASSGLPVEALPLSQEEPTLWPRRPGLQGLSLFSAYCAMILVFVLLQHV